MILAIPVVVLLLVAVAIILAKKSKAGDNDDMMVSSADRLGERSAESSEVVPVAPATIGPLADESAATFERLIDARVDESADIVTSDSRTDSPTEESTLVATPVVEPVPKPDQPTTSAADDPAARPGNPPVAEVETPASALLAAELAPEPLVRARLVPAPEPPEPLVRARLVPAPEPLEPLVPARVSPADPTSLPAAGVVAPADLDDHAEDSDDEDSSALSRFMAPGPRAAGAPIGTFAVAAPEPSDGESVVIDEPAEATSVTTGESDTSEEPVGQIARESDARSDPENQAADPVPEAPEARDLGVGGVGGLEDLEDPEKTDAPTVAVAVETQTVTGDEPAEVTAEVEPETAAGSAGPGPVLLQPEPELDPVDHVLKALIHRAKVKQVGIAEVAAELVEQANLEERDIDEVLAELVDRVEDDDNVDPSERLEELTLFNNSVPRRPGQLSDFERLDKAHKKRVIIRVLCLLVAMQEDNRLTPSEPRSEAETRHWPLARAVWPVAALEQAEKDREAKGEGDPLLPDRRLITKR